MLRFGATIHVAADGRATRVEVQPDGKLSAEMGQIIGGALLHAVLVPAVDHGKFVDGAYDYHFDATR